MIRGALAGLALAACASVAFGFFVAMGARPLSVAAAVVGVAAVGLVAGGWAGGPHWSGERARVLWRFAATTTAIAGVTASVAEWGRVLQGGAGVIALLILVVGAPAYALGMLLRALGRSAAEDDGESPLVRVLAALVGGIAAGTLLVEVVAGFGGSAGPLLLATSALLILPTFALAEADAAGASEGLVAAECSPFGYIEVIEIRRAGRAPERRMVLDGQEQGGEEVRSGRPSAAYLQALDRWLAGRASAGHSYLFLGGGAYTLPRRVRERDAEASITVVERDPSVTRLATSAFGLRAIHDIRTVAADARAWLDAAGRERQYHHVVLDVYDGVDRIPPPLLTVEALEGMKAMLSPGGVWAANVIGSPGGSCSVPFWSSIRSIRNCFDSVAIFPHFGMDFPEAQNVLVLAGDEAFEAPDRLGAFQRWEGAPAAPGHLIRDTAVETPGAGLRGDQEGRR